MYHEWQVGFVLYCEKKRSGVLMKILLVFFILEDEAIDVTEGPVKIFIGQKLVVNKWRII